MKYIALHAEKWLYGTTQVEMEFDEQAVFVRILCRAGLHNADPPGQIHYLSEEHLATQLNVPPDLLKRTLEKCKKFKKIKIKTLKRENKYILSLSNWDKYQHINFHQRTYRQRKKAEKEAQKKEISQGPKKHNQVITSDKQLDNRRGEERRKEHTIGEERRENGSEDSALSESEPSSLPPSSNSKPLTEGVRDSNLKEEFLSRLREFDGYPFDEYADGAFFHRVYEEYPGIDLLAQLDKKLKWWSGHPKALKQANKIPRAQLDEFFEIEYKFQQKRKFG